MESTVAPDATACYHGPKTPTPATRGILAAPPVPGVSGVCAGQRRRTGIEPADDAARRPPVLKINQAHADTRPLTCESPEFLQVRGRFGCPDTPDHSPRIPDSSRHSCDGAVMPA